MENSLRKILSRFKKGDFAHLLDKWGFVKSNEFTNSVGHQLSFDKSSKQELINRTVLLVKRKKCSTKDVHQLDLIYLEKYATTKIWKVFRLERIPGTEWHSQDPADLQLRLQQGLNVFYKTDVSVRVQKQVYWVRIALKENRSTQNVRVSSSEHQPSVLYVVHHPKTEYLMVADMKEKFSQYVMQVFMNVLSCHNVEQLYLKGRHLNSLLQLVVNKDSQGSFSQYRLCEVDDNPLERRRKLKKRTSSHLDEDETDPRLINENLNDKNKRLKILEETFGTNQQPILETIEYKLETNFHGSVYAPAMDTQDIFPCSVKFKGSNVIEGIKNLGKIGLAELPMKDHLGKIHSMAKNTVSLCMKSGRHSSSGKQKKSKG